MAVETMDGHFTDAATKRPKTVWSIAAVYTVVYETFSVVFSAISNLYRSRFPVGATFSKMSKKFFNVEFVDFFNIPLHRRLETLAVLQWSYTFMYQGLVAFAFFIFLLFTPLFFVSLAYAAWMIYDFSQPERGGRRWEWVRSWRVWDYYRDYFPVTLHRTADLDPSKNYIMVYHPHGIMAIGAFSCFCTNAPGFREKFPGLKAIILSLKYQFIFPFHRDYVMALGACPATRSSMDWLLTREGPGNAVVLVVGGAYEALEARPDSCTLLLNQRKGFIRVALEHGVPLVPVYCFGENNTFNQAANPPGSLLRRFQQFMTRTFTFSPPIFYGRGIFNYTFGFMPFRQPLNVVVGSPMDVPKVENPSEEQITKYHAQYIEHLSTLFEENKLKYGVPAEKHLTIL